MVLKGQRRRGEAPRRGSVTCADGSATGQQQASLAAPSDSNSSDDVSIYNATVISSRADEELPAELTASVAMFLAPPPVFGRSRVARRRTHCRFEAISEEGTQPTLGNARLSSQRSQSPLRNAVSPCSVSGGGVSPAQHRKAASLNDLNNDNDDDDDDDDSPRRPRWPANTRSPVQPAVARYSAPVRQPTPPGLPSFGTREAIAYSLQLNRQPELAPERRSRSRRLPRGVPQQGVGAPTYGDAFLRFLGIAATPDAATSLDQPIPVIGRASDGTLVQGRFPYRQSGHGMSLARNLDDHPFHRAYLSNATTTGAGPSVDWRAGVSGRSAVVADCTSKGDSLNGPASITSSSSSPARPHAVRFVVPRLHPGPVPSADLLDAIGRCQQPMSMSMATTAAASPQSPAGERQGRAYLDVMGVSGDRFSRYPTMLDATLPAAIHEARALPAQTAQTGKRRGCVFFWDEYTRSLAGAYCCCAAAGEAADAADQDGGSRESTDNCAAPSAPSWVSLATEAGEHVWTSVRSACRRALGGIGRAQ